MIFNSLNEETKTMDDDVTVAGLDPANDDTEEGKKAIADEINSNLMESAFENITFFDGGEEALKEFCVAPEVEALVEARHMSKKTFVRLSKNDDLNRRVSMAALILARNNKDPLFTKLTINKVKHRQLKSQILAKYGKRALPIARLSQKKHIADMKKMPALPVISLK